MGVLYQYIDVVLLINFALFVFAVYVIWSAVSSLKGINRGVWAIVSQLQVERREHATGSLPVSAPEDREIARRSHQVVSSAFGR